MALKKLFGVALLLGVAAACGGTTGKATYDADGDQPPANEDQPPKSSDQPGNSYDRPPGSSERPPSNPGAPGGGGGRLQSLCNKLCELVDSCDLGDMGGLEGGLCAEGACLLPAEAETQAPCVNEAIDFLDCILGLGNLCSDDGPSEASLGRCQQSIEAAQRCQGNYEPPDDDDPVPNPTEGQCAPSLGCENCLNACTECLCEANGDADASTECLTSPACRNP